MENTARTVPQREQQLRAAQVALDMPHYLPARATWCAHPLELRGPWPEPTGSVPATWPSLSGRGCQVPTVRTVPNYSYLINWFDPDRPEYTPNAINDAFRQSFDPMPPLPAQIPPGLLVTVTIEGEPAAGVNLFALPAAGQNTNPIGVVTDHRGTGWIWLQEPGRYILKATRPDGRVIELQIEARMLPLDAPPGYDYLQRIALEL